MSKANALRVRPAARSNLIRIAPANRSSSLATGSLPHRLSDQRFDHPKTYRARVEGVPAEALDWLWGSVRLSGFTTKPAQVRVTTPDVPPRDPPIRYRKSIPTAWIELTIAEGKNRQVRRMTAAVGLPTLRLIRVAIGGLRIDGLRPGEWRRLTRAELAAIR